MKVILWYMGPEGNSGAQLEVMEDDYIKFVHGDKDYLLDKTTKQAYFRHAVAYVEVLDGEE